ncbi:MAG: UDP-3-O-[3-hydroxymyristoyl] N-acetylglucosamine deacetylase [Chthonomonadales bacterium]|nr:UDP-3-O-[3-hydroxymyristoyl] N-acetylglucosamine deacetylase [Chthonomonadales bacterium]
MTGARRDGQGWPRRQTTLSGTAAVRGIGIHTGEECEVQIAPTGPDTGIVFERSGRQIPAHTDNVTSTARCTTLGREGAAVATVEHLLSAMFGLCIDNALVSVTGPELPALDGSAMPWVEALAGVGTVELGRDAVVIRLAEPVAVRRGDSWLVAAPADALTVVCVTDFEHPLLGLESVVYAHRAGAFPAEVAPARTFGFAAEVEALLASGLARGGSLDNALVIYDDRFSADLRLPTECARHKVLDLLGDISLAGGRLAAAITAVKPGHQANVALAARIAAAGSRD